MLAPLFRFCSDLFFNLKVAGLDNSIYFHWCIPICNECICNKFKLLGQFFWVATKLVGSKYDAKSKKKKKTTLALETLTNSTKHIFFLSMHTEVFFLPFLFFIIMYLCKSCFYGHVLDGLNNLDNNNMLVKHALCCSPVPLFFDSIFQVFMALQLQK